MNKINNLFMTLALALVLYSSGEAQIAFHHYLDSTFSWTDGFEGTNLNSPNCTFGSEIVQIRYNHFVGIDSMDGYWWYQYHTDEQSTEYCTLGPTIPSPPRGLNGFTRIREDSSGKIWFINSSGNNTLLYDFGQPIAVNDTLWMFDNNFKCKVGTIDSVYFGNEGRARYWCVCDSSQSGPAGPNYVIEGVGHNLGLMSYSDGCTLIADADQYMICASLHGDTIIVNSSQPCADFGHVVAIEKASLFDLDLFWDSESATMFVRNWSPLIHAEWAVYNVNGQKIYAGKQLAESIRLPNLSQGMYIFATEGVDGGKRFRFLQRD